MAKDKGCWIFFTEPICLLICFQDHLYIIAKLLFKYVSLLEQLSDYHTLLSNFSFHYCLATFETTDVGWGRIAHFLIFLETLLPMKPPGLLCLLQDTPHLTRLLVFSFSLLRKQTGKQTTNQLTRILIKEKGKEKHKKKQTDRHTTIKCKTQTQKP